MIREFAPAKVNLALHVTGRRSDGYHLLDSLVVFAGVGDVLDFVPTPETTLAVTGPFAQGVPTGPGNLVLHAAGLMPGATARITLEKNLPHAAGIGGGSADAAATLRGLSRLSGAAVPEPAQTLALGADVPVCVAGVPARMRGIGEELVPVPKLPPLWLVLVNPGVAVPTGACFAALRTVGNPPLEPPEWRDVPSFIDWLARQRNDLEAPARELAPEIGETLAALSDQAGCLIARMSGSGATCFGLFGAEAEASDAAKRLDRPGWWVAAAPILS
ncbi:4-(cytidine 5'-diphospho)-2-C-methyl-D-erythritol kinase [Rhodobacterales bacterium HKCCE2091]|nr:4-(cytidine 5'-diphospho)-2-C-methyl-D-erythritol kinase [Rhodobacterales bacterium HKCCE2091]